MTAKFETAIRSEFPSDRLTWQKAVPTFHPQSADEAARLIKLANNLSQQLFITGFGNNIDPRGKPFINMVSIRTDRLNKILEINQDDFYLTVGSGYPLREINTILAESNLWLPHSALSYVGSVGGSIAAGVSATLHNQPVPLKKYLIQAEIVTPEGEIITPGSTCFKSVAGYDIVKTYFGSWGLLGFIVSATFRVMPETGAMDFSDMTINPLSRTDLLSMLDSSNDDTDAVYCRKIKAKFDPHTILPIV